MSSAGRGGAGDHLAHGRVRSAISSRSPSQSASTWSSSASSISVPSNRSPRLSGAICGWSGSMIAAPSSASSASVASTGKVLTLAPGASAARRTARREREHRMVESSALAQRPARSGPGANGVALWTRSVTREPVAEVDRRSRGGRAAPEGRLDVRLGGVAGELDPRARRRATRLAAPGASGSAPRPPPRRRRPRASPRMRAGRTCSAACRVGRRVDDAERRRRRVLGRARRVRVERVALVEQRLDAAPRGRRPRQPSSSSVGDAGVVGRQPQPGLRRASRRACPACSRTQPPLG